MSIDDRPDVVVILTDEERAIPPYEDPAVLEWREAKLAGRRWFDENGVAFMHHYTGSLACVPSRPTLLTGQYPDVHGVTQTNGLGKQDDDSRMRWLRPGEVPTIGHWFRAAGYDTHYDGKWHVSHADLTDPETGDRLNTNDDIGKVDTDAVRRYLDEDPLGPFGFSGWVGPEPHGAHLADAGLVRDPLVADRIVAWLEDRYARRSEGDVDALRPFLLIASFVNPHDIVLFPAFRGRRNPYEASPLDPPPIPAAPTADEDLRTKPAAQIAFRASYPSAYGPARAVARVYENNAESYRSLYYRLHAEVDSPLDRVRRAVTEDGSANAVLVRTSDHGDLLGAHGGLHQKWFNLYDEATRVPFVIARVGSQPTSAATVDSMATSHVDLVPTLLAAAGIDAAVARPEGHFTEVHPLPGRDLLPMVDDPSTQDATRFVYLQTRDNMLEGDSGASGVARRIGRGDNPPLPLQIQLPAHVGASIEGLVGRVPGDAGGADHLWKLVRTFDDPSTWTEPNERHRAANGPAGDSYRTTPLPDEWELYDLTVDPIESHNHAYHKSASEVFAFMQDQLTAQRASDVPTRNQPWPYATIETRGPAVPKPRPLVHVLRRLVRRLGLHPEDEGELVGDVADRRALVVATNHGTLDIGKPTGVFASELTVPYYAFLDAGMSVDVASPLGGDIPVDPASLKPVVRTAADDRFLADDDLRAKVTGSLPIGDLDMDDYDLVFLAGGWGAAFDFGFSDVLAQRITEANAAGRIIGGVCHGPLGLRNAKDTNGEPLVKGRRISAVTDKQVNELGIGQTPHHPETELRKMGAEFESETRFRDPLANHWVVDGNLVTGQNQNAGPMVARQMMELVAARGAA
jgi:arylsulfatase A-like enzyme/putative intracellular protease/amidase